MYRRIRHTLPWLVGACWLGLFWWLVLDRPSFEKAWLMMVSGEMAGRYSSFEFLTGVAAVLFSMYLVDRLWCRFALWRIGVDSMKVHWSRLRTVDGRFICAACHGVFLLPPQDFSEEGWVHCGDCGHAVAPYGEMKPLFRSPHLGRT